MTDEQLALAIIVGILLLCVFVAMFGRKNRSGSAPSVWIDFDDFGDND